jgi:integrase
MGAVARLRHTKEQWKAADVARPTARDARTRAIINPSRASRVRTDGEKARPRWRDLRHEGACRLLSDGVDIRIIQLMLGHASIQQTQRYLNVTDEELRRGLEVSWINQGRPLRAVSGQ